MVLGHMKLYRKWKDRWATGLKKRRFRRLMELAPRQEGRPLRVLEVGCGNGKDMMQFMSDAAQYQLWGVDVRFQGFTQENFTFCQADGEDLPFPDKFFDLVLTVGVLEHIEPMEKLCRMIAEMDRVGEHLISVVPCVSTLVEPHCGGVRWPLKPHPQYMGEQPGVQLHLNFFTDHTWTKFQGFADCKVKRFFYLAPLIRNTVIYR